MKKLTEKQTSLISKYLSDLSKILVASTMIGFFVPTGPRPISVSTFIVGSFIAIFSLLLSVRLVK